MVFPSLGPNGPTLWASSTLLAAASPYYRSLLDSDFPEATKRTAKQHLVESLGKAVPKAKPDTADFDDSDDEKDRAIPSISPPARPCEDLEYHEVKITQTAYTTYKAVLIWIQTAHISFAPIRSTVPRLGFPLLVDAASPSESLASPCRPSPSPKSVYRLAHLLDLPPLRQLALSALARQLTPDTVLVELFGDVASAYDEVRQLELEFARAHWRDVVQTENYAALLDRLRRNEGVGGDAAGPVLDELLPLMVRDQRKRGRGMSRFQCFSRARRGGAA
ncbi:hypothetical protein JCM1840_003875 [Sporobolomyces johnsonii]